MEKNNNIENFFRKRLESQEFPYQETDWQKLEQRLDAEVIIAPKRTNGFSGKTMFIGIILLSGTFFLGWFARGFFTGKVNEQPPGQEQNTVTEISSAAGENIPNSYKVVNEPNEVYVKNQDNDFNSTQTDVRIPIKNEDKPLLNNTEKETQSLIADKSGSAFRNKTSGKENYQVSSSPNFPKDDNGNISSQGYISHHDVVSTENFKEDKEQLFTDEDIVLLQSIPPTDGKINFNSLEKPGLMVTNLYYFGGNQSYASNKISFMDRWMFGISLATDFNSVGMMHEKSLSAKIGGQLYFLITPNWWISAGIQYSNKKYNTSAEYYSPGNGYWEKRTNGVLPDNIFGTCSVFDIPVMVTYRFFNKEFISLTASAGVSNYLMQDEIYEFEFNPDNPGAANGWQTAENSMAPFSFGNVYLGIEWQTTLRTFLVIEPFLQFPFKEVGWGNVKIFSTGLQAKIKYKIGNSGSTVKNLYK